MTLVIMAAGLASRYGSTKQLDGVGPTGELLLEYSIFDARRAGFTRVVFIVRKAIEDSMREFAQRLPKDLDVQFAVQDLSQVPSWFTMPEGRTKPWGTVHAVLAARPLIESGSAEPFAALNADDFYGREAFVAAKQAGDTASATGESAAVLLPVNATLSPHGSVVRGISRVEHGRLVELDEVRDIHRTPDGLRGQVHGEPRVLTGDELASMNFWVFPASAMRQLAGSFEAFLKTHGHAEKSESLLPEAVSQLMAEGRMTVRALAAPGPWFGLTHQADRDAVAAGLQRLHDQGIYPTPLWS